MKKLVLLLALLAGPAWGQEPQWKDDLPAAIAGTPIVLDGDTLLFVDAGPMGGDYRVRLWGIDTTEMDVWPWGPWARGKLEATIDARGGQVTCDLVDADSYGRFVGLCFAGDRTDDFDLGGYMVFFGYAVGYRIFFPDNPDMGRVYTGLEQQARESHRGIWANFPD